MCKGNGIGKKHKNNNTLIKYAQYLFNQCINVGIPKNTYSSNGISIYPNPANLILNISDEQNQLQNSIITIINTLGETVLVLPFSHQINISSLAQGLYYLTLQDGASKKVAKIVKQ